jgi:hypothetical protein
MTEQELRQLVRRVIADRLGGEAPTTAARPPSPATMFDVSTHASHATFRVASGSEIDGPCLIEPHVSCDHCGYCKSMGH